MSDKLVKEFAWYNIKELSTDNLAAEEKYKLVTDLAGKARGVNPNVFDSVTEWILDDSQWSEEKLAENKEILMNGIIGGFKEQNVQLRAYLKELEPSGVVNDTVWKALDRFDAELSGNAYDDTLKTVVERIFADFSSMKEHSVRELIAGNKTGAAGTDSVDLFGYINQLKDCDASVQWTLFMPDVVEHQQNGFKVKIFEYKKMPAMRFIGFEGEEYDDIQKCKEMMKKITALTGYRTKLDFDVFFMHHYGFSVDVGEWHGVWGRFMKADTPVPEGFVYFDFVPQREGGAGLPYISQFAYAVFEGDMDAMHTNEGFDSDAMYDVTRNIMLAQGGMHSLS